MKNLRQALLSTPVINYTNTSASYCHPSEGWDDKRWLPSFEAGDMFCVFFMTMPCPLVGKEDSV